ncbi:MAG: endonuclease V [gamma proteobacterium symbiont of Ctena orbiculata]|uniref:Endonuclease V n=1 Tax=Candidatus Thiodiazotropha taylori TaxID=2792791 RepID=A0A944M955_9GAMM|nr:deoxyribonuclease V [Candidatus Thiodiazotropha taylori]PUB88784.1 MAG: deoxyribonuclease V [gamma proteobacterium symbiont of Ctena orbiculata]MBT2989594.1 deoxyribonuclease V [Candidatus Thiodiazotropha taylori]MBT2997174.1 deoxyribonuclease V [Candidatus Thiodiazotropha taylori]MBT3001327.1 deoxyribonuclease V [Candidatus Thiodiazotropha taylori]
MLSHDWNLTPSEAVALQKRLRPRVIDRDCFGTLHRVAGVDVGFEAQGSITRAAVSVLSYPELQPLEASVARLPTTFPYIPGLLSFREVPAILQAIATLRHSPDIFLCDGQGMAHPRRFGIACHLGVYTDTPAVGVAKTRLTGSHGEVPQQKGGWVPLIDKGETIGAVVRTRNKVKPLYISVGHKISLQASISLVLACTTRYRLPETTRAAHRLASG